MDLYLTRWRCNTESFTFQVWCNVHVYVCMDCLSGLVVRVPAGYRTEMYGICCEVRTEFLYVMWKKVDRLCGLVVRVPGYTTEM
jgi:hypothetical protein